MNGFAVFENELGNTIDMEVSATPDEVTVRAEGPTSLVEHTWTRKEADFLRELLSEVLDS